MYGLVFRKNGRTLDLHAIVRVPAAEHLPFGRLGISRERDQALVVRVAVGRRAAVVEDDLVDRQMERVRKDRVADAVAAPDAAVRSRAVRGVENPGELVALHLRRVETQVRSTGGTPGQDIGIVVAVGDGSAVDTDDTVICRVRNAEAVAQFAAARVAIDKTCVGFY